ncbi:hypothetical protein P3S68_017302 [Capsicum galapagoense]
MEELRLYRINSFVVTSNFKKFKTTTHKHKLIFIKTTSVEKITDPSFHMDIFNLHPFDQLTIHHIVDDTELFDVVGQVVTYEGVQTFKQGDSNKEASYWIAAKVVCFDLDHGWSYMTCNKCIIKVEQDGNSFFLSKMQFRGKSCSQV